MLVGGTALTAGETSIVQHCHPLNMSDTPTVVSKHDWVSSLAQQRRPAIDRSQSSELVNKIPSIEVLQLRVPTRPPCHPILQECILISPHMSKQ